MKASLFLFGIAVLLLIGNSAVVNAQGPVASEEYKLLKQEEGNWTATIKLFYGPTGPYDQPQVATAEETNQMIGPFFLTSDFKANFGGVPFTGHGVFGYDKAAKKYTGMWVDSFAATPTKMLGTYDEATKTITYETTAMGMSGPTKGKNVVVYKDADSRQMTMYMQLPEQEEMTKMMELEYVRKKAMK